MKTRILGDRYRLVKRILAGDGSRGVPELWTAQDAGDLYYIKLWKRQDGDLSDIKALWNRETRGFTRLQGYPGAGELFLRLHDLRAEADHYYAVLDGGQRLLLAEVLKDRAKWPWLHNLSEAGRRRDLWRGLLRIAEALSLLHAEGTLHRAVNPSAVFVSPEGQGDFRLSGFEWSLRIAGVDGAAASVGRVARFLPPELQKTNGEFSTATDWFDFGLLAVELLGVPLSNLRRLDGVRSSVAGLHTIRETERKLLLRLLHDNPEERVSDAQSFLLEIRDLVRSLTSVTAGHARNLILAIRLGPSVSLSRHIELASGRQAAAVNPLAQRDWVANDLRGNVRVTARAGSQPHFLLRGEKLEYRVRRWTQNGLQTWDIGYCENVETTHRASADDQHFGIGDRKLEVITLPNVARAVQSIRDRSAPWDTIFPFTESRGRLDGPLRDIHDFFRITQQLDTVLTASRICWVDVVDIRRSQHDTTIVVTPKEEADRSTLARHLELAAPAEQLHDWFSVGAEKIGAEDERDPKHDTYQLLERKTVDSEGISVSWRFVSTEQHSSGPRYTLRCPGNVPISVRSFFLARNHGGTIAQIKRRHRAIEDLRSYESLLRLIADPRGNTRQNSDELPVGRANIPLDESKAEALTRLWQTQPSFAIQGPPGTGKTTLIRAFADRLGVSDPSSQILITAHSHHTVDDVRLKLSSMFASLPAHQRPVLLRLGAREPTEHDIAPVTIAVLRTLRESEMAKRMPAQLSKRLDDVVSNPSVQNEVAGVDFRTMQLLIQDAANITLTTLNSIDLADLTERGRRFDWSIIEEAGKAHGFDMAAALSISHRLLMIGDHRQLPPFNSTIFKKLLGDPLRVQQAIKTGAQFAPTLVDVSIVEDEEGREGLVARCDKWRRMIDLFARVFEDSFAGEEQQQGPAATLTDQHRMHPHIANLVGRVFYPSDDSGTILRTPADARRKFDKPAPFAIRPGSWLPKQRIVWCDVPWKQRKEFAPGETEGLFASPSETRAVVDVLDELRPSSAEPCELQILSPYNDQLDAIREAIQLARSKGRLKPMFESPFDLRVGKRSGATVDEFQGSEADIVIVSLVRNNALVPWKSVGFLKEATRMNVLLSRARHKLIIIGSWDFFSSRCSELTPPDEEYAYIGRMMSLVAEANQHGHLAREAAPQ